MKDVFSRRGLCTLSGFIRGVCAAGDRLVGLQRRSGEGVSESNDCVPNFSSEIPSGATNGVARNGRDGGLRAGTPPVRTKN